MVAVAPCGRGGSVPKLKLAVSAYADGKGPCPQELMEAMWCDTYHIPPQAGALDDQDIVRLSRYDVLRSIYYACDSFNRNGRKNMSAGQKRVYDEIIQLEWERDHAQL